MNCPNNHGEMPIKTIAKAITFRGIGMRLRVECHVCPTCGMEAGTVGQTAAVQRAILEKYNAKEKV